MKFNNTKKENKLAFDKISKFIEAQFSKESIEEYFSKSFEYLLYTYFEKEARKRYLPQGVEGAGAALKKPEIRKKVFGYLIGKTLSFAGTALVKSFMDRFGLSKEEFNRYFNIDSILGNLGVEPTNPKPVSRAKKPNPQQTNPSAMGTGSSSGDSSTVNVTQSGKRTPPTMVSNPYKAAQSQKESLDDFDPEEKDWLQKQFDQIEKDNAEMELPDSAKEKEKTDALKPVDSRDQQEETAIMKELVSMGLLVKKRESDKANFGMSIYNMLISGGAAKGKDERGEYVIHPDVNQKIYKNGTVSFLDNNNEVIE